jgi:hypothetical protein
MLCVRVVSLFFYFTLCPLLFLFVNQSYRHYNYMGQNWAVSSYLSKGKVTALFCLSFFCLFFFFFFFFLVVTTTVYKAHFCCCCCCCFSSGFSFDYKFSTFMCAVYMFHLSAQVFFFEYLFLFLPFSYTNIFSSSGLLCPPSSPSSPSSPSFFLLPYLSLYTSSISFFLSFCQKQKKQKKQKQQQQQWPLMPLWVSLRLSS